MSAQPSKAQPSKEQHLPSPALLTLSAEAESVASGVPEHTDHAHDRSVASTAPRPEQCSVSVGALLSMILSVPTPATNRQHQHRVEAPTAKTAAA